MWRDWPTAMKTRVIDRQLRDDVGTRTVDLQCTSDWLSCWRHSHTCAVRWHVKLFITKQTDGLERPTHADSVGQRG